MTLGPFQDDLETALRRGWGLRAEHAIALSLLRKGRVIVKATHRALVEKLMSAHLIASAWEEERS